MLPGLEKLFAQLAVGAKETQGLALDLDNDGVETQSEFAAHLASLLTLQGSTVLHQLVSCCHAP